MLPNNSTTQQPPRRTFLIPAGVPPVARQPGNRTTQQLSNPATQQPSNSTTDRPADVLPVDVPGLLSPGRCPGNSQKVMPPNNQQPTTEQPNNPATAIPRRRRNRLLCVKPVKGSKRCPNARPDRHIQISPQRRRARDRRAGAAHWWPTSPCGEQSGVRSLRQGSRYIRGFRLPALAPGPCLPSDP